MPKVEVDEASYASQRAIVDLVASIEKNPKLRTAFLSMVKEVKPDLSIPEIDAAAPVNAKLDAMSAQMSEFIAAQKKREDDAAQREQEASFANSWNAQKNNLLNSGYMEDAIPQIEEFAKKRGIPDLEAAAALYEKQNPVYLTSPSRSTFGDFFQTGTDTGKFYEDLMKSHGEDERSENGLVQAALNDVRSANRRY